MHRAYLVLAGLTLLLLVVGALVTSNEAGDSVPDWPMSFGRWVIGAGDFTGNVRYEYSHRVVAGVVGLLTAALAVWAWTSKRVGKPLRWLASAALAVVVIQALIGGLRVLVPSAKPVIAVPHALVAQSFFAIVVALAVLTSPGWRLRHRERSDAGRVPLRSLADLTVATVLAQLVLGASFRHGAIGIIPHIAGAVVVAALSCATAIRAIRAAQGDSYLRRPAWTAAALLAVQVALGILAYLARLASRGDPQPLEPMISLTVMHVIGGALTLAALLVLALRVRQVVGPASARERSAKRIGMPARSAEV